MSGGIACFVIDHIPHPEWWFEEEDYKGLFVLGAMASALGALLNTPLLGASMLHELGDPPRYFQFEVYRHIIYKTRLTILFTSILSDIIFIYFCYWRLCRVGLGFAGWVLISRDRTFMESFVYFGIMSTIAFAMYYCWCTNTWIDHQDANLVVSFLSTLF